MSQGTYILLITNVIHPVFIGFYYMYYRGSTLNNTCSLIEGYVWRALHNHSNRNTGEGRYPGNH